MTPRTPDQLAATRAKCAAPDNLAAIAALKAAIAASGLSVRAYARITLKRDQRTVFRFLAGKSPIPAPVRQFLNLTAKRNETPSCAETAQDASSPV